jgi:hypothetical protein
MLGGSYSTKKTPTEVDRFARRWIAEAERPLDE